ncbi:MD-2-related lipid-recognition domain-containing protein [Gautieria morchelliformis]|nr:MD-2-related lipid-recognition domain-containing protein [Gautieria morchelliformis]
MALTALASGLPTDVIEVKSLKISPDPPKPGDELTVTASGYVSRTIEDGATADVTVKLGLIKLLSKTFDICEEAKNANATLQCPVEPGDYDVVQKVALPWEIPRARFNVDVKAYNNDESDLMCARIMIDFISGQASGFRIFGR